jgi:hypothetical protein
LADETTTQGGGFRLVADTGLCRALPLTLSARPERKSDRRRHEARRDLVVRGWGSEVVGGRTLAVAQSARGATRLRRRTGAPPAYVELVSGELGDASGSGPGRDSEGAIGLRRVSAPDLSLGVDFRPDKRVRHRRGS